jgi:hypothetical protein
MSQDEEHLNLLSIFHYIVGGLTMLISCIFLVHVGMGVAMTTGAFGHGRDAPPREVGWIFIAMGSAVILAGWTIGILMIVGGRRLKQRRSRVFCLVVAGISCIIQPFGTILGVFTIVVLMRPSVISLFDGGQPPAVQQSAEG